MVSESQERMLAVVVPDDYAAVAETCKRWGVVCTAIGTITDTGRFVVRDSQLPAGEDIVADMPAEMLAESAPEYDPEMRKPAYLDKLQTYDLSFVYDLTPEGLRLCLIERGYPNLRQGDTTQGDRYFVSVPSPESPYNDMLLALISSPNICSRAWIWRQYDHQVQNNTVVLPGCDAAVLRIGDTGRGEMSRRGIAASTDCNGRYCYLDPYLGAQIALAEGGRNLACVGAEPAAITDCLNFGNPEKPEVFWTFHEAVRGLSDACKHFGIPVISGNVSFYNESFGNAIYPTPVVGIVGVLDDISQVATAGFKQAGDTIVLVGETADELGGSEYLTVAHGLVAGRPPALDLELEGDVQAAVRTAVRTGLLQSAHDVSEGGIAIALAESCVLGNIGARVALDDELPAMSSLFSETQSRVLVSVTEQDVPALLELLARHQLPYSVLGEVGGERLFIEDKLDLAISKIAKTYNNSLEEQVHQR
jgi:phosphoribosylformylglycinamidine synthase